MPALEQRLGKDVLVVGREFSTILEHAGFDANQDAIELLFLEEDTISSLVERELSADAALITSDSYLLTSSHLARSKYESLQEPLIAGVEESLKAKRIQHPFFELASCDLPLDSSNKQSIQEVYNQYREVIRLVLKSDAYDALSFVRFTSANDLRCALMAARSLTSKIVMATIDLSALYKLPLNSLTDFEQLETTPLGEGQRLELLRCLEVAQDLEASVFGVALPLLAVQQQAEVLDILHEHCSLPSLICFDLLDMPYHLLPALKSYLCDRQSPELMLRAAVGACSRGVQFVRPGAHTKLSHAALLAHFLQGQTLAHAKDAS